MYGNKSHSKHYRVGGTRGGQDHFKWDEVKNDKYRENYLGNSLHAPVGRWQKGKDLTWYAKSKTEQEASLEEERRRLRALDEDLMNEALGIRAQKKWNERETLDNDEIRRLLAKGETNSAGEDETDLVDRSKGLGAAPAKFHEHIDRKSRLAEEIERLKKESKEGNSSSGATKSRVIALPTSSDGDNNEPKKRSWEEIAAPGAKLPTSQPTTDDKEKTQEEKHRHVHRRSSRSRSRDRPRHDHDRHVSRHDRDTSRDSRNRQKDRDTGDNDRDRDRHRNYDRAEKRRKRSRSRSLSRSDDDEDSRRRHRHHHKEKKHHKDKKHH